MVPAAWAVTLTAIVALAPLAIGPSGQLTMPLASEQVALDGVAETKSTPAGSVSVTVAPAASSGPLFCTVRL